MIRRTDEDSILHGTAAFMIIGIIVAGIIGALTPLPQRLFSVGDLAIASGRQCVVTAFTSSHVSNTYRCRFTRNGLTYEEWLDEDKLWPVGDDK